MVAVRDGRRSPKLAERERDSPGRTPGRAWPAAAGERVAPQRETESQPAAAAPLAGRAGGRAAAGWLRPRRAAAVGTPELRLSGRDIAEAKARGRPPSRRSCGGARGLLAADRPNGRRLARRQRVRSSAKAGSRRKQASSPREREIETAHRETGRLSPDLGGRPVSAGAPGRLAGGWRRRRTHGWPAPPADRRISSSSPDEGGRPLWAFRGRRACGASRGRAWSRSGQAGRQTTSRVATHPEKALGSRRAPVQERTRAWAAGPTATPPAPAPAASLLERVD